MSQSNNATPEQLSEVRNINRKTNLYDIMGVPRDANEDAIRKAYKKLAVKFHPDRNSTPGADEAFKKISAAYSILSDAQKKRSYDVSGEDTNIFSTEGQPRGRSNFGGGQYYYEADFDPEDIFRAFFGGGMQFGNGGFYTQRRQQRRREPEDNQEQQARKPLTMLFQLLPILVLVLSSFGGLFQSTPEYSFIRTSEHQLFQRTQELKVEFFAKSGFDKKYTGYNLKKMHQQIENEYVQMLKQNCREEKYHIRELNYYAQNSYSRSMREAYQNKIENFVTTNCNKLKRLYAKA